MHSVKFSTFLYLIESNEPADAIIGLWQDASRGHIWNCEKLSASKLICNSTTVGYDFILQISKKSCNKRCFQKVMFIVQPAGSGSIGGHIAGNSMYLSTGRKWAKIGKLQFLRGSV